MTRLRNDVRDLFAKPLVLSQLLEDLEQSTLSDSVKHSLKSTAIAAVTKGLHRHGAPRPTKEEVLAADIRDLLPVLHIHAKADAIEKGHLSPTDHASRAHRFIEFLGVPRFTKATQSLPFPTRWDPLLPYFNRPGYWVASLLSRACSIAGYPDAPRVFPPHDRLLAAVEQFIDPVMASERLSQALGMYRTARERLLQAEPERAPAFSYVPKLINRRACHFGVFDSTDQALRGLGLDPAAMTPWQKFEKLAPGLARDGNDFAKTAGSASYAKQCRETLLRVAGWAVLAGRFDEFRTYPGLERLFLDGIEVETNPSESERAARLGDGEGKTTACILQALAEGAAAASLARSPVGARAREEVKEKPYFTKALHEDCIRIWSMVQRLYGNCALKSDTARANWQMVLWRWKGLLKELNDRQIPAELLVNVKDKAGMIKLVTLPQLVCLGIPLRRREVLELKASWHAARDRATEAGHSNPSAHEEVRRTRQVYLEAATGFSALTLALEDGLRIQQYRWGRLGNEAQLRLQLRKDDTGRPVGILGATTCWGGDAKDPSHLKVRSRKRRQKGNGRTREVRLGYVDAEILWDFVSLGRPELLVDTGAIDALDSYDLEADLAAGRFAIFPSSRKVKNPEHSSATLYRVIGKELYHIVTTILRPEVGATAGSFEKRPARWRGLFAPHILRLLTASYWLGVRELGKVATFATNDEKRTLEQEYVELEQELQDLMGTDTKNWQHFHAYDVWMDRLYLNKEVFDPLLDPLLPVPEHLAAKVAAIRDNAVIATRKPRVRRARPGQRPPTPPAAKAEPEAA